MYVINLFGGPSIGKSTLAALLFGALKSRYDLNCEYVNEYAKDLVYEKRNQILLKDQLYIFAKQNHKLLMIKESGDVDFIINDSPLLFSNIFCKYYGNDESIEFKKLVVSKFKSYKNLNFVIKRNDEFFRQSGRIQNSLNEVKILDEMIFNELHDNEISYQLISNIDDILNSNLFLNALGEVNGKFNEN